MKDLLYKLFLIIGATTMAVMASSYFFQSDNSFLDSKSMSSYGWYVGLFKTHIALGIVSIIIGPFQFIRRMRERWIKVHRFLGKIYVLAIFISATAGLIIAQYALGGLVTRIGFSTLSVLWFYFTYLAYSTIRKGQVGAHKMWMFRSYALTFSAFTLRLFLLIPLLTSVEFVPVYQFAAWACWITNLLVCEWILSNSQKLRDSLAST